MAIKEAVRTGGRSARVQESIHRAVRDLLLEQDRSTLSVPLIATRAGVTPSTIYRRWGDLTNLLADAAIARLRPDEPID
ncbi:TetR family transcriptional regulator, partial [Pseudomonas viridiflava]